MSGFYEVDGRYFSDRAGVQVDDSDNNVLQTTTDLTDLRTIVRRGFRADD